MAARRSRDAEEPDVVEDDELDADVEEDEDEVDPAFDEEFDEDAEGIEEELEDDVEVLEDEVADDEDLPLTAVTAVEDPVEEDEEEILLRVVEDNEEDADEDTLKEGEFICRSCYLVKGPTQLADARRQLCVDCV